MSPAGDKHIVFICSSLNMPGGIERAIVNTANLFKSKGQIVTLVILAQTRESFYPVDLAIKTENHNLHFGISEQGNVVSRKIEFIQHIRALRHILKRINGDTVITTEYVFTIAAQLALPDRKIWSWEHHHFHHLKKNRFWQTLYNKTYPRLERVVCLNSSEEKYYARLGCTTSVIPNFVATVIFNDRNENSKTLLTVGWVTHIKGTDLVPKIAALIFAKHPDWTWRIIGKGIEKEALLVEINQNGLSRNVQIAEPLSPDIEHEYNNAALYVMTSRFECFPMVLLEAMSHGIPAVAFDCPTGPAHIIKNREDGMLAEAGNVSAMAAAVIELIEDERKRKEMGAAAHKNIQRFSPEAIYALWERTLGIG